MTRQTPNVFERKIIRMSLSPRPLFSQLKPSCIPRAPRKEKEEAVKQPGPLGLHPAIPLKRLYTHRHHFHYPSLFSYIRFDIRVISIKWFSINQNQFSA